MTRAPGRASLHAAVLLLSLLGVLFQFAQTRLFSATLDYHLTFLVLSGALLGVGAGGTLSALFDAQARRPSSAALAIAAGVATLVALAVETRIDPTATDTLFAAGAGYVLGVVPVLCASWVIVRALRERPADTATLYAADLAGAALGAVLGYLFIGVLGDQGLFGLGSGSAFIAAGLLIAPRPAALVSRATLAAAALSAVAALSLWGEVLARPLPGPLKFPNEGDVHEVARWDPLARIDVSRVGSDGDPYQYAFLIDPAYAGSRPPAKIMTLDMGALTPIVAGSAGTDLAVMRASILAAPFALAPRRSVLVVGPGGGIDVLVALSNGAAEVTAVEVNRTEVALMRGPYAAYSGDLYRDPRLTVHEDEARSFIRRSDTSVDLIVITVVDSFAALSAGAYALTENYLYTEEAMADYLTHLRPGGAIALSRWYRSPPVELVRSLSVAHAALRSLGNEDPARSIAVLRYRNFGLVIIRNDPFDEAAMARLRSFSAAHGFDVALDPLRPSGPLSGAPPGDAPTDDRPFFFDTVPLSDVLDGRAPLPYGYAVLATALVFSVGLSAGGLLLPLYRGARRASARAIPVGTSPAAAVGLGFIFAELVLLQRLTLYLGQPSLALSTGVAALLVGAATGSALSGRTPGGIRGAALQSAAILIAELVVLPLVTDATLGAGLTLRVAIGFLAAFLVGVPLGGVFPRVIADVARIEGRMVSWVWAVNGAASVIGALVGTAIALFAGFTWLGVCAAACYVIAALPRVRVRPLQSA